MSRSDMGQNPPRALTKVTLLLNNRLVELEALIDSEADDNFMDWQVARDNQVGLRKLDQPRQASALNGRFIFQLTHCTEPCELTVEAKAPESHFSCFTLPNTHSSWVTRG